jgi:hypothetical protein
MSIYSAIGDAALLIAYHFRQMKFLSEPVYCHNQSIANDHIPGEAKLMAVKVSSPIRSLRKVRKDYMERNKLSLRDIHRIL